MGARPRCSDSSITTHTTNPQINILPYIIYILTTKHKTPQLFTRRVRAVHRTRACYLGGMDSTFAVAAAGGLTLCYSTRVKRFGVSSSALNLFGSLRGAQGVRLPWVLLLLIGDIRGLSRAGALGFFWVGATFGGRWGPGVVEVFLGGSLGRFFGWGWRPRGCVFVFCWVHVGGALAVLSDSLFCLWEPLVFPGPRARGPWCPWAHLASPLATPFMGPLDAPHTNLLKCSKGLSKPKGPLKDARGSRLVPGCAPREGGSWPWVPAGLKMPDM